MKTIKNHYFFAVIAILGLLVSGKALAKEEQLIPETCVIQVVTWDPKYPQNKYPVTLHVNNGQATYSSDQSYPGCAGQTKIRHTGEFQGVLKGNTIVGTLQQTMHKWSCPGRGSKNLPCTYTRWGSWTNKSTTQFNPDGTLSSASTTSGIMYDDCQGDCSEQGLKQTPQNHTNTVKGTWSIGGEAITAAAADLKARALLGYNKLVKEKEDCEKYLNTPAAKIDYIGEHPESPTVMKRVKQIKDNEFLTITEPGQKASLTASYRERLKELNSLIPKVKKLIDAQKFQEALSLSSH